MGWGALRVWNDDTIQPNSGFPTHPHRDMEIITYVRQGAITHQDSLGNKGRTEAGDVQVMSAGSGIRARRIQSRARADPHLSDLDHPDKARRRHRAGARGRSRKQERPAVWSRWRAAMARDADALPIRTDARVLGATEGRRNRRLSFGQRAPRLSRCGHRRRRSQRLASHARDGAAIKDIELLKVTAIEDSEIILVDAAERVAARPIGAGR